MRARHGRKRGSVSSAGKSRTGRGGAARRVSSGLLATAVLHGASTVQADDSSVTADLATTDRYTFTVRSETYLRWFERALLPGPNGALVREQTLVPAYEYVSLQARDLDLPSGQDNLDIELSAFTRVHFVRPESEQAADGDITVANVLYHERGRYLRLGRQFAAGGAARYVRFDGLSAGSEIARGFSAGFYAGFTVLPRWDQRPGYYYLGSAADDLVRDPEGLPDPERSGYWLAGVQANYQPDRTLFTSLTFHEQHERSELAHQRLGAEAHWTPHEEVDLSASAILDTSALLFSDAHVYADWYAQPEYTVSAEYLHTVPALFLSHQSVLSVFSTDSYDEAGAQLDYHPLHTLTAAASGYVQAYSSGDLGLRSELRLRAIPDRGERVTCQAVYGRLLGSGMGYHSLRGSLRYRVSAPWTLTGDGSVYIYDHAIDGHLTSRVYAANLEWSNASSFPRPGALQHRVRVLWGASLVQSPTARADVQTLLRLIYAAEGGGL